MRLRPRAASSSRKFCPIGSSVEQWSRRARWVSAGTTGRENGLWRSGAQGRAGVQRQGRTPRLMRCDCPGLMPMWLARLRVRPHGPLTGDAAWQAPRCRWRREDDEAAVLARRWPMVIDKKGDQQRHQACDDPRLAVPSYAVGRGRGKLVCCAIAFSVRTPSLTRHSHVCTNRRAHVQMSQPTERVELVRRCPAHVRWDRGAMGCSLLVASAHTAHRCTSPKSSPPCISASQSHVYRKKGEHAGSARSSTSCPHHTL